MNSNKSVVVLNTPTPKCLAFFPSKNKEHNAWGFTLIELLVVVLIIGILAAVAVPQYKKAVLKSRFSSLYPIVQPLAQGQESYYLNQGEYAKDLSALDVSLPGMASGKTATLQDGSQVKLGVEENHIYVRADKDNNALMIYQNHSPNFAGETHCEALIEDDLANWLCDKGLQGTLVGQKFGYKIYALDVTDPNSTLGRIYYEKNGKNATNRFSIQDGDECVSNGYNCNYLTVDNAQCTSVHRGCIESTFKDSKCVSLLSQSCRGTFDNSTCEGTGLWDCLGTFKNKSVCISGSQASCQGGSFSNEAVCRGRTNGGNLDYPEWGGSCYGMNFTGKSYCSGEGKTACYNNSFKTGSYCVATTKGSCANNTYDETSFCAGSNCPSGTPKGTWNETTESYELDGWNGSCCNAAYMTSGACPSGSTPCAAS